MKIEEITIFFPDGNKTFFKVGNFLMITGEEGPKKTDIKIKKIEIKKKESRILLSNKKMYVYTDMPFSYTASI